VNMSFTEMSLREFLNAAVQDQELRTLLVKDPGAALEKKGIKPTTERVAALRTVVDAILTASFVFDCAIHPENV
jgi:hypothetical protein